MDSIERRRARENVMYRLVDEDDIIAGKEIEMVRRELVLGGRYCPTTKIRLDVDPIGDRDGIPYVYYHQTYPAWEGQCFVPLASFIGKAEDEGSYHVNYWLPLNS